MVTGTSSSRRSYFVAPSGTWERECETVAKQQNKSQGTTADSRHGREDAESDRRHGREDGESGAGPGDWEAAGEIQFRHFEEGSTFISLPVAIRALGSDKTVLNKKRPFPGLVLNGLEGNKLALANA